MLTRKSIGFIGAGNLAESLIKGLITSGTASPARIVASDRSSARLAHLAEAYEVRVLNDNAEAVRSSDVVFLAVKPDDARAALAEIAPDLTPEKLLISAAAGVTTTAILDTLARNGLKSFVPVVRAMPNTPSLVLEGATGLCPGMGAGPSDVALARALFEAVGIVIEVEDEALMDAVTGLSGSGPAYVFLFMEALAEAGVKMGLAEDAAMTLALQTTLGAAKLAIESPRGLEELRRAVASPGGTTVEGLKALEKAGMKEAVIKAVEAATKRAKELALAFG
jgi:pyrroline-5-carboxylate reductase